MKILLLNPVLLILAATAIGQARASSGPCINHFGQREWAILLEAAPADIKKKFVEDPEMRRSQAENLRELFAHACEAVKSRTHLEKNSAVELRNIKAETVAMVYEREVNKQKSAQLFGHITPARIEKFYAAPANVSAFEEFLSIKIQLLKKANSDIAHRGPTEEEKQQAREFFAKIRITESEYLRSRSLSPKVRAGAELQARLQQAQFLATLVAQKLAPSVAVTDEEVDAYLVGHPELDVSKKRELAGKLLERAKAGEDFASLANQYSEDPGNNGSGGVKQGGFYAGIKKGVFVPAFENAALSLEAGKLYPSLVESDFGYHIIKLEKTSGAGDDLEYDVRHILISTGHRDPNDPSGREMPLREFVRSKLQAEKEAALSKKMAAANRVKVEDYVAPTAGVKKTVPRRRR